MITSHQAFGTLLFEEMSIRLIINYVNRDTDLTLPKPKRE